MPLYLTNPHTTIARSTHPQHTQDHQYPIRVTILTHKATTASHLHMLLREEKAHDPNPYGHDTNPYADDVPLRPHPQKSDTVVQHDYDDSAITDRPPPRQQRKKGLFSGRIPWVVYTLTLIQCVVFIAELAKNGKLDCSVVVMARNTNALPGALTKSPIEIHPQFNPMIGPSPYVLINMGARYVPCMRKTDLTLQDITWPCPNSTSTDITDKTNSCHLNNLCGFGAAAYTDKSLPHQWYRFILPMFLHAGFIHIAFNMLLQILLGGDMEREIGSIRFTIVYLSSGIFGFVLGGNFAPEGIASTGASGSLFGIIALLLLDLLYHWGSVRALGLT
ncbi:uncharacterized protein KY384_004755 [Bacidia gigantensis]|uniref:uncharacterized protein n=1 Tax=Bacidia gigantensis TaxID=2732470 RepID=UPI001D03FDC7|nr:uncharacterized protein KY384_004755 [Bacidia gigantensis]KAG8530254.1 hypothetical protein KY384_004755 [Bacidia gigantensis]